MIYQKRTSLSRRHLDQLHELYQREWWTKGRSLEDVAIMAGNSDLLFCVVDSTKDQLVGFARVLTDRSFKALIFDLIVASACRKEGLGNELMNWILSHPDLRHVKHLELYCLPEFFPFYEKWGFTADVGEVKLMRLVRAIEQTEDSDRRAPEPDETFSLAVEGVLIRRYVETDLEDRLTALVESAADISPWLMVVKPDYSEVDNRAWFKRCEHGWRTRTAYHFAVIEPDSNTHVGECFLNHINRTHKFANIAYWIRTSATGRGYASAAVKLIARFGFDQLRLQRLEIFMSPDNLASQRVAEKAGAKKEGRLRNRILIGKKDDAFMYSLVPEDLPPPSVPGDEF